MSKYNGNGGLSLQDYDESRRIVAQGLHFYALLAACLRQADTQNYAKLRAAFPEVEREIAARYESPGGVLPSDVPA